ncbi:energy-coupling factor ABC transporter ATP-binding protein [Sulfitobacter aestuariivivens]|uniref:ABC transporter ATP-binding protein n=1 Tax=Sulfitobacter aestuariivivens TaxID=2766981 RepID=A0A927HFA2_9RHOB|nr:ABC transporter ATP-binding protein [Sulfitobacter aestuariivivens]MBD3664736.1 ABC transporter ATP-binding protein [Sulfitobacter aestuariivivens]
MPTDDRPLISLDGVSYSPDGLMVIDDLTLKARERRIGVLGRNGSGKTSLARLMAGLVPADRGTVRIADVDVARDRKGALGVIGILFQNPDHQIIFPTVEEEIGFGLAQMGRNKAEVADGVAAVLRRFGKAHWASAAVNLLSQGQRQLVCLMSVLVMNPRVIVLDEPFAGLDMPTTLQLQRVLAGLDLTIVMITHQPDMLKGYDRVIWLERGAMVQDGPASEVVPTFTAHMTTLGGADDLSDLAG